MSARHHVLSNCVGVLCCFLILATTPARGLAAERTPPIEGHADARWQALSSRIKTAETGGRRLTILQIGDSHTAGDYMTGRLRELAQQCFGDGGPGFLLPGRIKAQRSSQVQFHASPQWQTLREKMAGLGGFIAGGKRSFQTLEIALPNALSDSQVALYVRQRRADLAPFSLYSGGVNQSFAGQTLIESEGDFDVYRYTATLASPASSVTLVARRDLSELGVLGVQWASSKGGAVVSHLGVNGARIGLLDEWRSNTVKAQLKDIAPDLVILAFGTNDAADSTLTPDAFAQSLERTREWLSEYVRDAAVLIILPPDSLVRSPQCSQRVGKSRRHSGKARPAPLCYQNTIPAGVCGVQSNPRLHELRSQMRQAAERYQWRVWDWSALTGQNCGARLWQHEGGTLYQPDGIHLTPEGYGVSADHLFRAILAPGR